MEKTLRLDLTRHQQAALLSVLSDYMSRCPDALEVSIDAVSGEEIEITSLLALVMDAEPLPVYAASYAEAVVQLKALGWEFHTEPEKIVARYKDYDLAEQVPRPIIYADIGVLIGHITRLEQEKRQWKQRAARGKSSRASSRDR